MTVSDRCAFQQDLIAIMRELRPDNEWSDPMPTEHLWEHGYIDSIGLLEIIYYLEERSGRSIELTGEFISKFVTLDSIYDEFGSLCDDRLRDA